MSSARLLFQLGILGGLGSIVHSGFNDLIRWQFYVLMSVVLGAYLATIYLIPKVKEYCLKADLFGRDINKNSTEKVPESLGVAVGVVFIVAAVLVQPLMTSMLGQYNAALLSICLMWFLGFADDVFDLRWAIKIFCSFIATLPLLVAYSGPTNIIVPKPLREYLGGELTIGYFYHLYMSMIAVFCTNSINIHAGINGLEASQSAVIAVSIILHNFIELSGAYGDGHLLSLYIMFPFLACVLALLYFNWYPSQVFVGDSFTYLAGMTFAVSGILGRFSKTLMLFFLPELLNFLLSIPQLLRIIPCPRHRLPKLDEKTGKLNYTKNFTLLNATLFIVGPTHERTLCIYMVMFQILCSAIGFGIRYSDRLTNAFYDF